MKRTRRRLLLTVWWVLFAAGCVFLLWRTDVDSRRAMEVYSGAR